MAEVTGIDHIYITVSDLARSELFYDQVLLHALNFRKSKFTLGDDPHIQYFSRLFGYVLRPARVGTLHDAYAPVCTMSACGWIRSPRSTRWRRHCSESASQPLRRGCTLSTRRTTPPPSLKTQMVCGWR
jgi:catechol 2,3-dioxygenase-like lactoylglutathione lyase family enzyme